MKVKILEISKKDNFYPFREDIVGLEGEFIRSCPDEGIWSCGKLILKERVLIGTSLTGDGSIGVQELYLSDVNVEEIK